MGRVVRLATIAFAAGCSKAPVPVAAVPEPEPTLFGRFTVTPANSGALILGGRPYLAAWRLDTKTGDLELCLYDPDPPMIANKPMPELSCSNRDEASAREQ